MSQEKCDPTDFASFKMLNDYNDSGPSRRDRLDTYLENMMCDISKAVWGSPQGDATTWRVFNTADLPSPGRRRAKKKRRSCVGEKEHFDAKQLHQHSQQLLHFLRQLGPMASSQHDAFEEVQSRGRDLLALPGSDSRQRGEGRFYSVGLRNSF